jgi:arylsulfatase A-like enzyme
MSVPTRLPNILIIYPDQMRADAMSCAGNPCLKTPHIDRLAYEGVKFKNAFSCFPLCAPFRAALFTGKYPHTNGMYANHYRIRLGQDFLAEILRDNGYQTGYFGKWHLDGGIKHGFVPPGERRLGFETFVGFNRGHDYFGSIYYRDTPQPFTSRRFEPDYQTDHLIDFLNRAIRQDPKRPFFAMISYGPPHPPLVAPAHHLRLYSPNEVHIPPSMPLDEDWRTDARQFLAHYYGMVSAIDHNLGRVLDWLDLNNLGKDTLVIFLSDHGEMAGEHGLYAKKTYYRSAMQVPLLIRYPARFASGQVVSSLVDPSVDTMPTLLELLGIPIPAAVQGKSYLSLLEGSDQSIRELIYYEILREMEGEERFPVPERGIRTLEWLYIRTQAAPKALFDLSKDPFELVNLIGVPAYQTISADLETLFQTQMSVLEDDWSKEAPFPPEDFQTHAEGAIFAQALRSTAIVDG